jgi:predicted transglutaminase-like cysteine proteinase
MRHFSFHIRIIFLLLGCVVSNAPFDAYAGLSYFEMSEEPNSNLKPFPKWTGVLGRFGKQRKVSDDECGKVMYHPCVIKEWKKLTQEMADAPMEEKLEAINDWVNEHPYVVDQLNWGVVDYWATPYEFMELNAGDCEDYAISKYYSLRAAGVPEDKMRIMIVQDLNLGGIIHAILGVYDDGKLWILDNQIKQVKDAMSIYHYRPIYGTNEEQWWRYYPKN